MTRSVAILGGGIMGCTLALFLAHRGFSPVIFEAMEGILGGASRWNEGKIHLGYMYTADASFETARRVLPGGLAFVPLVESLLATPLSGLMTASDDVFLCHGTSVVAPDVMAGRMEMISSLVNSHPDAARHAARFGPLAVRRLSSAALAGYSQSDEIVAGFAVPERSVQTRTIADLLQAAVAAEPRIRLCCGTRVLAVEALSGVNAGDRWRVITTEDSDGPFDHVVNALWNGRLPVDRSAGLALPDDWSHRYRLAVFLRTRRDVATPSTLIAVGPFGDIKNYNGRDFYLSWYPVGLQCESKAVEPQWAPPPGATLSEAVAASTFAALARFLPGIDALRDNAESVSVGGGWVYAAASGSLADPAATIHCRADFGITRRGSYVSIDTGKYSTAPWMAERLARQLA